MRHCPITIRQMTEGQCKAIAGVNLGGDSLPGSGSFEDQSGPDPSGLGAPIKAPSSIYRSYLTH